MSLDELRYITVHRFPLSKRRPLIMAKFTDIVCKLVEYAVRGDLIIDGSFVTGEIEPSDMDFTLCVSEEFYRAATGPQLDYINWIGDDKTIKATHLCDCYLCVECSEDSDMYFDGIQNREYWTK